MSHTATDLSTPPSALMDSGSGLVSDMSALQREFARQFVLTGGNGTKAAVLAGYSDLNPSKAATRCLLNQRVIAEIKRLSVINVGAYLPLAIRTLIEIMCNEETPARDRISAANSLLDRAGMAAPKGGVQVNVGVQVTGNEVQALIGSIWDAKGAKSEPMSCIGTDIQPIEMAQIEGECAEIGQGGGGVQAPGSLPPSSPYPSPSTPPMPISAKVGGVSRSGSHAAAFGLPEVANEGLREADGEDGLFE